MMPASATEPSWDAWIELHVERSSLVGPASKAGIPTGDEVSLPQLVMAYIASPRVSDRGQLAPSSLTALLLSDPFINGRVALAHEGLQRFASVLDEGWNHPRMLSIGQALLGTIVSKVTDADQASEVLQRVLNHPHLRTLLQKPQSPLAHYVLGRAALYQHRTMWPQSWMRLLLEVGARPLADVGYGPNSDNLLQKACAELEITPQALKMVDLEQQHPVLSALADHGLADWLATNKKGLAARQLLPTALEESARPAELRARQRQLDSHLPSPHSTPGAAPRF